MWEGRFPRGQPTPQPKERKPSVPNFLGPSAYGQTYDVEQPTFYMVSNVAFYTVHHVHAARPWVGPHGIKKIVLGPNMYAHTFIPNEC